MAKKNTVSKVLVQAIEAMGAIREKLPTTEMGKKLTNDRILERLAKIGVATQADLSEMQARIEKLEAQLAALSATPSSSSSPSRRAHREPETRN